MSRLILPAHLAPLVFRGVAVAGLVAALVGGAAGWALLSRTSEALAASLDLTADTLEALDASAGVAQDTITALSVSLSTLEATATDLDVAFDDGEALMSELAELVRADVAESIGAVEASLPGLIQVAGTVDRTLTALNSLPIGPGYNPEESFAEGLGELAASLDGLPERLSEQADLIDETGGSLADVGDGVAELTRELAAFDTTLAQTSVLLGTYDATIIDGRGLVQQASDDLGSQLAFVRFALVLFSLTFAALQVVPLHLAAVLEQQSAPEQAKY